MDSASVDLFQPADPVLSTNELLQIHGLTSMFVRGDTGQPPSLEDVQQALSEIRLRVCVPESVCHTFQLAKRLFLFGYFEYGFFTISRHYSFLALEAALYSRWIADLPAEITVQVPPSPSYKTSTPTHQHLFEHWVASGRKLKVEGQDFPNSVHKILVYLAARHLITLEQHERIEAAMQLRNDMSHLEAPMIVPPSVGTLAITAGFINAIYNPEHVQPRQDHD